MPTLLYSPGIRIVIDTRSNNVIDVSDDIESGTLTLRENSFHSLSFRLSNGNGQYNSVFTPNDRVIVQMKRLNWLQTFTGYLDVVPYFSVYSRSVSLSATCTLKRIQFHWWDPGYSDTLQFLQDGLTHQNTEVDGGMSDAIKNILTGIVGWELDKIHIGTIPGDWMSKVAGLWSTVQEDLNQAYNSIGGLVVAGSGNVSSGTIVAPLDGNNSQAPPGTDLPATSGTAVAYGPSSSDGANTPGQPLAGPTPWSDSDQYYSAMNWGYAYNPDGAAQVAAQTYLGGSDGLGRHLIVANAQTGAAVIVRANDGFGSSTGAPSGYTIGLSPTAYAALGLSATSNRVDIAWAPNSNTNQIPTGPYSGQQSTSNSANVSGGTSVTQDSTGGIQASNFAEGQVGKSYGAGDSGPNSYDGPGLCKAAWQSAGQTIPSLVKDLWTSSQLSSVPNGTDPSNLQPGDILFTHGASGSVAIFGTNSGSGANVFYSASGVGVTTDSFSDWISGGFTGARRVQGAAQPGGVSATGMGAASGASSSTTTSGLNTSSSVGSQGQLLQGDWYPQAGQSSPLSQELTGLKTLMNDVPIMQTFTSIVQTGLRSYCAAPNGDFIAWFPDYFDQYGYAAKWHLSTIEMQDFNVIWSDTNLITHEFAAGSYANAATNTSIDPAANGASVTAQNMVQSMGVATIDIPALFSALFNIGPDETGGLFCDVSAIYQQFGPRPHFDQIPVAAAGLAEFWYAIRIWMQAWASQFSANVSLTFMPELWPGMLLVLPDQSFQAYITSVTHTWDLSANGGFQTSVQLIAPSSTESVNGQGNGLIGLARGS